MSVVVNTKSPGRLRLLLVVWLCAVGSGGAVDARQHSSPTIDASTAFALSGSLNLLTKAPVWVSQALAEVCVAWDGATAAELDRAGPHANFAVSIYASDIGVHAMLQNHRSPIPVGTIVLKEKLRADSLLAVPAEVESTTFVVVDGVLPAPEPPASPPLIVDAVGGMVKREPGFDPEFGDWEYFYADGAGGFSTGRLSECRDCHARAADSDFLFSRGSSALSRVERP